MAFTSIPFLVAFLPVTFIVYWLFFKHIRLQNMILLLASCIFYGMMNVKYLLFLWASIGITFFGVHYGYRHRLRRPDTQKKIYKIVLVFNFFILILFKYTNFAIGNINWILQPFGRQIGVAKILLPVGLSFYIFQSSTYLFHMIKTGEEPEKSFIRYALFVSFFPTIVSGPIQRSEEMLPKIREKKVLSYHTFREAIFIFLWGAFLKMVIADRIALFTGMVLKNYKNYGSVVLILSACLYSVQIYADFSGYSHMAIAVAKLFGYDLFENFHQPYFATNIPDFWRRWHISLTKWLTDYIYIPLGGNRRGVIRKYIHIFIVFLVSGIWHGAAWTFIVWGLLHAGYQIIGQVTKKKREKLYQRLNIKTEAIGFIWWQRFGVFFLTTFAWIFFSASSLHQALGYIRRIFIAPVQMWVLFDGSLAKTGMKNIDWWILILSILLLLIVSKYRENKINAKVLVDQNIATRYVIYISLFFVIIIFGVYGPDYSAANFIYAGF